MALPKISHTKFKVELISQGKEIEMRPFLVKEEKILLMAMEGRDDDEIIESIIQILQNCILTPGIKVKELPSFDVEHLFLKLRQKSIGETVQLTLKHKDESKCNHATPVTIDLDKVKIKKDPNHNNRFKITPEIGVTMTYPTPKALENLTNQSVESLFKLIASCIKEIYTTDEVFADFTQKEINEWVEQLSEEQLGKLVQFIQTMPYLSHMVKFQCPKCGDEESYELKGLKDFFI